MSLARTASTIANDNNTYFCLIQLNDHADASKALELEQKVMHQILSTGFNARIEQNRLTFFRDQHSVTQLLSILREDGLKFGEPLYSNFGGHCRPSGKKAVYLVEIACCFN